MSTPLLKHMNQNMRLALLVSRLTSIESDVGLDLHYETELLTYLYDVLRTYPSSRQIMQIIFTHMFRLYSYRSSLSPPLLSPVISCLQVVEAIRAELMCRENEDPRSATQVPDLKTAPSLQPVTLNQRGIVWRFRKCSHRSHRTRQSIAQNHG